MTTLQPIFPERCKGSKFRPVSWSDIYKEGAPVVGWGIEEKQAEPRSLFDRANDLHEKAAMPWTEAEKLALSEQGIDDAQIEELIHEHASTALVEFTKGWEDLQEYTRALLVHAVAHPAPKALAPLTDEQMRDAFAQALTDVYVCNRVWSAWSYGTMTENDFSPASECDEVLDSLVQAAHGIGGTP